jgi:hypothetical protein
VIAARDRDALLEAVLDQGPVTGLTHNFYRYPARFSPTFVRAVIEIFSEPGDLVFDPFMGGGTTIVEASALGRCAVGTDISSLAVFVSKVKTTVIARKELSEFADWIEETLGHASIRAHVERPTEWAARGYQRNISTKATWRIRKLIELVLADTVQLRSPRQRRFARCATLRTSQWALDARKQVPSAMEFRRQLYANAREMITGMSDYTLARKEANLAARMDQKAPICLHRSVVGIEEELGRWVNKPVRLILTSPPYPGVHVLYHRWQVQGRKETPAPFWIADSLDGSGASFYTFGDRNAASQDEYYRRALDAFRSIAKIATRKTIVVQMIAFSRPIVQLPRYLEVMQEAGFTEIKIPAIANRSDGRIWRSVPNRKWYASQRGLIPSSNEVVLLHKLS